MNKTLGFSTLFASAVAFGSFGIWIRLLNHELDMYQQIVFRNVIALAFALAFIVLGKRFLINLKKVKKLNLILYALSVPLAVIFYNIAMLNQKIAVATFIFYTGTIIVSFVLSTLFFAEKITPVKITSLILALIGLAFFVIPFSAATIGIGLIAGLASGAFDAVSNAFRKDLSGRIDKFILVFITALGGVIVSGFMIAQTQQSLFFFSGLSLNTWIVGLIFGFLLVAINYLLLIGFQHFDLGLGTIVLSAELLFATLFGLLIFKEQPATKEIIGGLFILAAIITPNANLIKLKTTQINEKRGN